MYRHISRRCLYAATCLAFASQAQTTVPLDLVHTTGANRSIGTVTLADSPFGLVLSPALRDLPPGVHGFHVHEKGSCALSEVDGRPIPAGAAGGHYDPDRTGRHGAPWGDGHLGDLPALFATTDGQATTPVLAPRLRLADVAGRALMVHAGGDSHADHPAPLGGGGVRIACGVVAR